MADFDVCLFSDKPCVLFVDNSGKRSCLIYDSKGRVVQACVHIRFKGMNSVRERGFGMSLLEKLERGGLVEYVEGRNNGNLLVGRKCKRGRLSRK